MSLNAAFGIARRSMSSIPTSRLISSIWFDFSFSTKSGSATNGEDNPIISACNIAASHFSTVLIPPDAINGILPFKCS